MKEWEDLSMEERIEVMANEIYKQDQVLRATAKLLLGLMERLGIEFEEDEAEEETVH